MGQKAIWKGTDTQYITAYLEGASPFTYNTPLPFATRDCYMCWLRLLCESQHMEADSMPQTTLPMVVHLKWQQSLELLC